MRRIPIKSLPLLLALVPTIAAARTPDPDFASPVPAWRLGPYLGAARHSPDGANWGATPDRDHLFLGVHAAATVLRLGRFSLAYAPELVPLLLVTNNPKYATESRRIDGRSESVKVERGRGPVVGAAVAPFGLEADLRFRPRWHAYGAGAIGAVWFTREVPIAGSRAFNYTFELGAGFLWECRAGRWLQVGYKFHHLSNNDSAPENPGLDANLFYVGWERLFKRSP